MLHWLQNPLFCPIFSSFFVKYMAIRLRRAKNMPKSVGFSLQRDKSDSPLAKNTYNATEK